MLLLTIKGAWANRKSDLTKITVFVKQPLVKPVGMLTSPEFLKELVVVKGFCTYIFGG